MMRKGAQHRKENPYGAPAVRKCFRKAPKFANRTDEEPYVVKVVRIVPQRVTDRPLGGPRCESGFGRR